MNPVSIIEMGCDNMKTRPFLKKRLSAGMTKGCSRKDLTKEIECCYSIQGFSFSEKVDTKVSGMCRTLLIKFFLQELLLLGMEQRINTR